MIRKNLKFRLYPTISQAQSIEKCLELCRELYNAALQQRIWAWRDRRASISRYDQHYEIKNVRKCRPDIASEVYANALFNVIDRIDLAFQNFFRRVKTGGKPGFPRFKNKRRYNSFTYKGGQGFRFDDKYIRLSKIGRIKWRPYCEIPGAAKAKTCTIKREADGYYAIISFEWPRPEPLPETGKNVGIDLGLLSIVATSDGEIIPAVKTLAKAKHRLRYAQKRVSRRKKGSNRRQKAVNLLARAHQHFARSRKHFLDNITTNLIRSYDLIAIEALSPQQMKRLGGKGKSGRGLRRSFNDAAWGEIQRMLAYKSDWYSRTLIEVDPYGTSQACSTCGAYVPKDLSARMHCCTDCGTVLDRDVNAARNILTRALHVLRGGDVRHRAFGRGAASGKRELCDNSLEKDVSVTLARQ